MEDQFVTYDISLKLKKLGFNEKCFGYFKEGDLTSTPQLTFDVGVHNRIGQVYNSGTISAPLWQQAISFLESKGVLVSELWDGWEVAKDGDDFEYVQTKENAILKGIEIYQASQTIK